MNNYCIYLRKSRADKEAELRGEGETLARHERALLDLAKRLKLPIKQIYREIVSGETISARPIMQILLSEVEKGQWDGVLVMEVERLARGNTIDQGVVADAFKYGGCKIITPMKTYDPANEYDEEYFEFGLFMSRREYKTINRRLQRGKLASVLEGKYVGSIPPYGYKIIKVKNGKGNTLEVSPDEAPIVKMIFEYFTKGIILDDGTYKRLGCRAISIELNKRGIPGPKNGNKWTQSSIRGIVENPTYIGKIKWNYRAVVKTASNGTIKHSRPRLNQNNKILVDGLHPAIIDESTFNQASELIRGYTPHATGLNQEIKNPLAGLLRCGKCGHAMRRRPAGTRQKIDALICDNPYCDNIASYQYIVEEKLISALHSWLDGYKIDSSETNTSEFESSLEAKIQMISALENQYKKLIEQNDNIYTFYEQEIYTTDVFLERSKLIAEKLTENRDAVKKIQQEIEHEKQIQQERESFMPKLQHTLDIYECIDDVATKNQMLKDLLEKVEYTKTVKGKKGEKCEDFSLKIYPKLQKKGLNHQK